MLLFIYEYFFRTCLCFMNVLFCAGALRRPASPAELLPQGAALPFRTSRPALARLPALRAHAWGLLCGSPGTFSLTSGRSFALYVLVCICRGLVLPRALPHAPLQSDVWLAWGHCSFPGVNVWLLVRAPFALPSAACDFVLDSTFISSPAVSFPNCSNCFF